jgi:hypothetical protein
MHKTNKKQPIHLNMKPTLRPFEVILELSNQASDPRLFPSPHLHEQNKSKTTNELKSEPNSKTFRGYYGILKQGLETNASSQSSYLRP